MTSETSLSSDFESVLSISDLAARLGVPIQTIYDLRLSAPTLILHGTLDTSSPFQLSTRLRELRPDIVDLEAFCADHTMSWNSNPERWRTVIYS
ncbi:MAG: hypothetical protein JWM23_4 [Microbacteriaceae bacterium]|jgi:pimeloyl-ACP methyl ester carboxylesterase|nr:hypothetical protein [Microbacteriaceae bacterium]